jgi:hypothetical protein
MSRAGFRRFDMDTGWAYHRKMRFLQQHYRRRWPTFACAYFALCGEAWASRTRDVTLQEAWVPTLPCEVEEARAALAAADFIDDDGRIPESSWADWFEPVELKMAAREDAGRAGAMKRWGANASPVAPHSNAVGVLKQSYTHSPPSQPTQPGPSALDMSPRIEVEPTPICPVHDAPMRPSKGGGWYCSKKVNGEYCKHSAVGTPEEDPYDRAQRVRDEADKTRLEREQERRRRIDAGEEV